MKKISNGIVLMLFFLFLYSCSKETIEENQSNLNQNSNVQLNETNNINKAVDNSSAMRGNASTPKQSVAPEPTIPNQVVIETKKPCIEIGYISSLSGKVVMGLKGGSNTCPTKITNSLQDPRFICHCGRNGEWVQTSPMRWRCLRCARGLILFPEG
jgi:hypothetical protein